jgi:hypothetical protein
MAITQADGWLAAGPPSAHDSRLHTINARLRHAFIKHNIRSGHTRRRRAERMPGQTQRLARRPQITADRHPAVADGSLHRRATSSEIGRSDQPESGTHGPQRHYQPSAAVASAPPGGPTAVHSPPHSLCLPGQVRSRRTKRSARNHTRARSSSKSHQNRRSGPPRCTADSDARSTAPTSITRVSMSYDG